MDKTSIDRPKMVINLNGKIFTNPNDAKLCVLDRGFLYGDSVYEVARTYHGIPFLLDEHLNRLQHSAMKIDFVPQFSKEKIIREINSSIGELGEDNLYIRIIISRGVGEISLAPLGQDYKNNLVIIVKRQLENPASWYQNGVKVIISSIQRIDKRSFDPNIKSGNYLNNFMAIKEAHRENAFDAIMLNSKAQVTEGSTHNIWMVKNNKLFTPPLEAGILEGITRKTLLTLAKKNNIATFQENFLAGDLINADEIFLTSTTKELIPVSQIDNSPVGTGVPGKTYKKLHLIFKEFVKSKTRF